VSIRYKQIIMSTIQSSTFEFLSELGANNNREWFAENKNRYQGQHELMIGFADEVLNKLKVSDEIETVSGKKSLMRIYRDVRFSKNKEPYKTYWGGGLKRATKQLRGGYYYHIEEGNSFVGGGFWGPNADDLKLLRQQIAFDEEAFRKVIGSKKFQSVFGELLGDQLKTAPKGFPKDHSAIDLLRYKQYIIKHDFTDEEVLSDDFAERVVEVFEAMRPFLDLMSNFLTTDLNGEDLA
jgi:uncharacterized protein (TIGR02453 family)